MSLIFKPPTGGKLYQAGAKEIPQILKDKNISLLVLAAEEYQPKHIKGTGGAFERAEVIYVPMKDTIFQTRSQYRDTVSRAQRAANETVRHLEQGNNVLSTCWAGLNRSGLVSGLAMTDLNPGKGKETVRQIRKNRSWRALSNLRFARTVAKR